MVIRDPAMPKTPSTNNQATPGNGTGEGSVLVVNSSGVGVVTNPVLKASKGSDWLGERAADTRFHSAASTAFCVSGLPADGLTAVMPRPVLLPPETVTAEHSAGVQSAPPSTSSI